MPTGADSGTLHILNLSSVTTLAQIEHLVYDGEGGNDTFSVGGTGGDDTITHTPGSGNDEGSVRVNSLLGVTYQNLGAGATLNISGAGGTDRLVVTGTAGSDTFGVSATGVVALNSRLALTTIQIEALTLNALGGDDAATIASGALFADISVIGGDNGTGSDSVSVTDSNPAINFATGQITNVVAGPISLNGDRDGELHRNGPAAISPSPTTAPRPACRP